MTQRAASCAILSLTLPLALVGCASNASTSVAGDGGAGGAPSSSAGPGGVPSNLSGAGGAGASAGASAGNSGTPSTFALPESCSEFGFDVQLGCETCPALAPTCDCLDGIDGLQLLPEQACTSGKCLTAVDCERVCQNFDPVSFGPQWGQDVVAVQDCVGILRSCNGEAECGGGELCIFFGGTVDGYRGSCTAPGSVCNENADCLQGSRCIAFEMRSDPETGAVVPYGVCSTGEDDTACVTDDDCVAPHQCISQNLDTFVTSQCATGQDGEPCDVDDDCVTPYQCVTTSLGGIAECSAGALDDPCGEASDCQSGSCSAENPGETGTCIP